MRATILFGTLLITFTLAPEAVAQGFGQPVNTNGSFEETDPGPVTDLAEGIAGWVLNASEAIDEQPEFEIVEDPVQHGERALSVHIHEAGPDDWSIEAAGDSIPAVPGATYRYSVWARSDEPGATANFTVGNYDTETSPDFQEYGRIGSGNVDLTDEWQAFSFEFTVTDEETLMRAPIHFSFGENVDRVVYIDNLQIINLDDLARPVIVHAWPTVTKAFYMEPFADDPTRVRCNDVIAPEGYGELIGGSERIHNYELLKRRILEHGLPLEAFDWYLDLRKYGSVPHSGFGLGLERTLAWITGLSHLREAIPFPRMLTRMRP
jgi:hypothetical protein